MSDFTRILNLFLCLLMGPSVFAQQKTHISLGAGNPILPGYFADPTVKKFGDTYYIYATTDGNGGGFGPAQVWLSKDFVNWRLQDMNWPTTKYYWAPDVTQAPDGKYYMYYCQPVEIFGAWASTPVGPWTPLLPDKEPVVRNFLVPDVITLDGQTFRDDDGKMYLFWGTWGIYPNHGCGVGLLNPDMKSFAKLAQIPNTDAKEFFEAPFMFKRKGVYYLTYSSGRCEDGTYRVQYAVSKTGPMGPFVYGKNSPILTTNEDGTVHGPGHQSVLQEKNDFYLIYHRHNNPHSGGGYHRQVAADKMVFDAEGNIEKIVPTHNGIGFLGKNENPSENLLLGKKVNASSAYSDDFKAEYAVDDNNGTLWKPKNNTCESVLTIDLGLVKQIKSVHTQFEYATWYYQYVIESSLDGNSWTAYADQTKNTTHGSPMIDAGDAKARYLRLTITNTEYPGLNKAVWNIRVYSDDKYHPAMAVKAKDPAAKPAIKPMGLLVDLDARQFEQGAVVTAWQNNGKLGGLFHADSSAIHLAGIVGGKKAVFFPGNSAFRSTFKTPASLSGNSSFSIAMWVNNPVIEDEEPVLSWTARGGVDMTNATVGYGSNKTWGAAAHWGWADMAYHKLPEAGKWHHIALVFDGTTERLFVDGVLDKKELKMLFLDNLKEFLLGTTADRNAYFSGAIASLKVYDIALTEWEITAMANEQRNSDAAVYLDASQLDYGPLNSWKNEGARGGSFTTTSLAPEVMDMNGKIAVSFKGKSSLQFDTYMPEIMNKTHAYAIAAQVMSKRLGRGWHYLVKVVEPGSQQFYIDGQAKVDIGFDWLVITDASISIGNAGIKNDRSLKALSSFIVYDHSLNEQEVTALYLQWKKTIHAVPGKVSFKLLPKALSTDMVSMTAGAVSLPGNLYQYYFSGTTGKPGNTRGVWMNTADYINYGLQPGSEYVYRLKARDNYGNITPATPAAKVETDPALFTIFSDNFNKQKDFLRDNSRFSWDGLRGKADTASTTDGALTLRSTNTKWDGTKPEGPFLYKEITGDFIVQVEVSDVSGFKNKKTNGANDAGLMVLASDTSYNLIQNSIFPGWGSGNMITNLSGNGRAQVNNSSGWGYYKYLQIQRSGNTFYLRACMDGINWKDLPGSPIKRTDMTEKVSVGLFHATYGAQSGYGKFDNFKLTQPK